MEIYLFLPEKYFDLSFDNYAPFVCSLCPPIGPRCFRRCFASPTAPNRFLRKWKSSIQLARRTSTPWRSRCTWKEKGRIWIRVLILDEKRKEKERKREEERGTFFLNLNCSISNSIGLIKSNNSWRARFLFKFLKIVNLKYV